MGHAMIEVSVGGDARAHGLKVRMLYDADNRLKKKGVIAGALSSRRLAQDSPEGKSDNGESQFVAVRVEGPSEPISAFLSVLRVQHARTRLKCALAWIEAEDLGGILIAGTH